MKNNFEFNILKISIKKRVGHYRGTKLALLAQELMKRGGQFAGVVLWCGVVLWFLRKIRLTQLCVELGVAMNEKIEHSIMN